MPDEKASAVYLGARVPEGLARAFERVATNEDRTVSAELRRLVRRHVEEVLGPEVDEASGEVA